MTAREPEREYIRPEVMAFAMSMEATLRVHDSIKGDSYKGSDVDFLLMRLREEVEELHDQIEREEKQGTLGGATNSFAESVDVGNIAMMLAYRLVPDREWWLSEGRSRPHPAPTQPIESTKGMEHRKSRLVPDGSTSAPEREESRHTCINLNEHDAAIARKAREEVLDAATLWLFDQFKQFTNGKYAFGDDWLADWWIERVGYLRTPEGQKELESLRQQEKES